MRNAVVDLYSLFECFKFHDEENWAEELFLQEFGVWGDLHDSWLAEIPLSLNHFPATQNRPSRLLHPLYTLHKNIQHHLVMNRSNQSLWVKLIPDLNS